MHLITLNDLKISSFPAGQEEKAGQVLEEQGETDKAMMLYMKANKPAKAARLALRNSYILHDEDTMGKLKNMLVKQGEED